MQREHDAVGDEAHVERRRAAPRAQPQDAERRGGDAVRPSTMATGDRSSHLPNSPAKPNSSTAACSATSAPARRHRRRQVAVDASAGLCHRRPQRRTAALASAAHRAVRDRAPRTAPHDAASRRNACRLPSPAAKAIAAVRNAPGTRVKVAVSDIDGVLRGKYLHKDKFYSAAEGGFGFCDVVFGWDMMDVTYDNTTLTGWHKGFPDVAREDRPRHATAPCRGTTACRSSSANSSQQKNGKEVPLPICPRQVLKRVLKRAEKLGVMPMCGMEFEWFNFAETPQSWADKKGVGPTTITPGMFGYSLLRANANRDFFAALMDEMARVRRADRGPAHRDRPRRLRGGDPVLRGARGGRPRDPVQDRREGDRRALRHHAELHGEVEPAATPAARATSTSRCPTARRTSSTTPKGRHGMSKLFESYLAGQVAALMEFAPMFWPTINSYKRLVDGFWAPVKPTWGVDNRTASFRVIAGLAQVDAPRDALPRRRHESVSRGGRVHRRGPRTASRRS